MIEYSAVLFFFALTALCDGHMRGFIPKRTFLPTKTEIRVWYPQGNPFNRHHFLNTPTWKVPLTLDGSGTNVPHFHISHNGHQFRHSHPFGDHTHIHDAFGRPVFPNLLGEPYADTGMNWMVPRSLRDLNTWAVVNPDSVLTADDSRDTHIPDAGDLFPDVDPSLSVVPDPAVFPTSDKKQDPVTEEKPLDPIVPGEKTKNDKIPGGSIKSNHTGGVKFPNIDIIFTDIENTKTVQPQRNDSSGQTCHKTGCTTGHECVFDDSWICPIYIPDVPCGCRPGCRVDYTFVPFGKTITMDKCGNTCSCLNMYGAPECTQKKCEEPNRGDLREAVVDPVSVEPKIKQSAMSKEVKSSTSF